MKGFYNRIIAGSFTLVILFFSCVSPVYALGVDVGFDIDADFWSWVVSVDYHDVNYLKSFIFEDICRESPKPDGLHNFKEQRTTIDGKTDLYYVCEYCGKSAGEVGKESYDNQVAELPASGYGSDGSIYVLPVLSFYHLDDSSVTGSVANGGTFSTDYYRWSVNLPSIRYKHLKSLYHSAKTCRYVAVEGIHRHRSGKTLGPGRRQRRR